MENMSLEELERIKSSVLEIVERICPNSGDQWYDPEWGVGVRCAMSNTNFRESNKIWIVNGHTISPRTKELAIFPHLYRALGLEARDAVEAERVKFDVDFQMLKNQILQSDDSIKLRDDLLKASESRAAKLVEALGEIRKPATIIGFGKKATGKMRAQQLEEDHVRVRTIANAAIAAHKEGGVQ